MVPPETLASSCSVVALRSLRAWPAKSAVLIVTGASKRTDAIALVEVTDSPLICVLTNTSYPPASEAVSEPSVNAAVFEPVTFDPSASAAPSRRHW